MKVPKTEKNTQLAGVSTPSAAPFDCLWGVHVFFWGGLLTNDFGNFCGFASLASHFSVGQARETTPVDRVCVSMNGCDFASPFE